MYLNYSNMFSNYPHLRIFILIFYPPSVNAEKLLSGTALIYVYIYIYTSVEARYNNVFKYCFILYVNNNFQYTVNYHAKCVASFILIY